MDETTLQQLLVLAVQKNVSDVHFQVGSQPLFRLNGNLIEVKYHRLTPADTLSLAKILTNDDEFPNSRNISELDTSYSVPDLGRFRVNIFMQRSTYGIVLRIIPLVLKSFSELKLPHVLEDIANLRRGLVLVTGATGNGKSTTIASILNHINKTRKAHVITIEDPIEFLFKNEMSVINQREVGTDTESLKTALRAALRQDPDIIMVGEMRDLETVEISIKAAETGHLVLSTIHTPDVQKTIGRLVSFFSPEEQELVRARLAENLKAVVSLRLVLNKLGTGRIPACEIMRVTRSLEECIRNADKTDEMNDFIAKGRDFGMQTFDQHLIDLVKTEQVSVETAKLVANHPDEVGRMLLVN